MPVPSELPVEVLTRLRVEPLDDLGGRLNRHWSVRRGAERLVLRRWHAGAEEIAYERRLLDLLDVAGWPVPVILGEPHEIGGRWWTLSPELIGAPRAAETPEEEAARGAALAALHATTSGAAFAGVGRRPGWRTAAATLGDERLDRVFADAAERLPQESRLLREQLRFARDRFDEPAFAELPTVVVHGDWALHNLLFRDGRLSGVLDWEMARREVRIAEFPLAWRGSHHEIVRGYDAVAPLTDAERRLLVPVRTAHLLEGAFELLSRDEWDDGWIARQLARGPADPFDA